MRPVDRKLKGQHKPTPVRDNYQEQQSPHGSYQTTPGSRELPDASIIKGSEVESSNAKQSGIRQRDRAHQLPSAELNLTEVCVKKWEKHLEYQENI